MNGYSNSTNPYENAVLIDQGPHRILSTGQEYPKTTTSRIWMQNFELVNLEKLAIAIASEPILKRDWDEEDDAWRDL